MGKNIKRFRVDDMKRTRNVVHVWAWQKIGVMREKSVQPTELRAANQGKQNKTQLQNRNKPSRAR